MNVLKLFYQWEAIVKQNCFFSLMLVLPQTLFLQPFIAQMETGRAKSAVTRYIQSNRLEDNPTKYLLNISWFGFAI